VGKTSRKTIKFLIFEEQITSKIQRPWQWIPWCHNHMEFSDGSRNNYRAPN